MLTSRILRRLAGLAAVSAVALVFASPAQAQQLTCPGTFHVLHNDRIGPLQIPAGHYSIILIDQRRLSCAEASDLFRQFLEDYNGRLPRPWRLDPETGTFRRGPRSRTGFSIGAANTPSGGSHAPAHPHCSQASSRTSTAGCRDRGSSMSKRGRSCAVPFTWASASR